MAESQYANTDWFDYFYKKQILRHSIVSWCCLWVPDSPAVNLSTCNCRNLEVQVMNEACQKCHAQALAIKPDTHDAATAGALH